MGRMANLKLGAQLYTVRDAAEKDLPGTLAAVRAIGFTGVELAGYGNLKTATDVRKAADDAGIKVVSSHVSIDSLKSDFAKVVADQNTLGNTSVVIPWLGEESRKTPTDWIASAERFNDYGRRLAKEGLSLSYHNHAFEFDLYDGQTGMNLLLQHSDPTVVGFEVDVYWVAHGKHEPVNFLESLGGRLRLLHLKDQAKDGKFAPVGTGVLDFAAICKTGSEAGVAWGFVEQDDCYGQDPLAVLRTGYENLKKLGYA